MNQISFLSLSASICQGIWQLYNRHHCSINLYSSCIAHWFYWLCFDHHIPQLSQMVAQNHYLTNSIVPHSATEFTDLDPGWSYLSCCCFSSETSSSLPIASLAAPSNKSLVKFILRPGFAIFWKVRQSSYADNSSRNYKAVLMNSSSPRCRFWNYLCHSVCLLPIGEAEWLWTISRCHRWFDGHFWWEENLSRISLYPSSLWSQRSSVMTWILESQSEHFTLNSSSCWWRNRKYSILFMSPFENMPQGRSARRLSIVSPEESQTALFVDIFVRSKIWSGLWTSSYLHSFSIGSTLWFDTIFHQKAVAHRCLTPSTLWWSCLEYGNHLERIWPTKRSSVSSLPNQTPSTSRCSCSETFENCSCNLPSSSYPQSSSFAATILPLDLSASPRKWSPLPSAATPDRGICHSLPWLCHIWSSYSIRWSTASATARRTPSCWSEMKVSFTGKRPFCIQSAMLQLSSKNK